MPFAEAVRRCSGSGGGGGGGDGGGDGGDGGGDFGPILEPLLNAGERYYLRSVGGDTRKEAADFPRTFPDLARECNLLPPRPDKEGDGAGGEGDGEGGRTVVGAEAARRPLLDPSAYHSSVLRLASLEAEKTCSCILVLQLALERRRPPLYSAVFRGIHCLRRESCPSYSRAAPSILHETVLPP